MTDLVPIGFISEPAAKSLKCGVSGEIMVAASRNGTFCVPISFTPAPQTKNRVKLPPLGEELYEYYPVMSAQTHADLVKDYAREAVRAALVTPAPETNLTGWQPIETAPKDGRHVILYCDYYGVGRCAWESSRGVWRSDDPNHGIGFPQPTYWMPLPDVPEGTVRAEIARLALAAADRQP